MTNKIAYIIPEFPGQTHNFFWREFEVLKKMDIKYKIISTKKPSKKIVCHTWSQNAINITTYLYPISVLNTIIGIISIILESPNFLIKFILSIKENKLDISKLKLFILLIHVFQLIPILKKENINHIHIHSCADAAFIGYILSLFTEITYSLTLHGDIKHYKGDQYTKWKNALYCITVNNDLKSKIVLQHPEFEKKIFVAPMGVDTRVFKRSVKYKPFDNNSPFILFSCGRLAHGKGHHDVISAINDLIQQDYNIRLKIAGEGEFRHELELLINKHKLQSSVELLGAISEEKIKNELDNAHCFILASHNEALGVATMEAMAMELPVIVSDTGGVSELVTNNKTGLLIQPRNIDSIKTAILKIFEDSAFATTLGKQARNQVDLNYNTELHPKLVINKLETFKIINKSLK